MPWPTPALSRINLRRGCRGNFPPSPNKQKNPKSNSFFPQVYNQFFTHDVTVPPQQIYIIHPNTSHKWIKKTLCMHVSCTTLTKCKWSKWIKYYYNYGRRGNLYCPTIKNIQSCVKLFVGSHTESEKLDSVTASSSEGRACASIISRDGCIAKLPFAWHIFAVLLFVGSFQGFRTGQFLTKLAMLGNMLHIVAWLGLRSSLWMVLVLQVTILLTSGKSLSASSLLLHTEIRTCCFFIYWVTSYFYSWEWAVNWTCCFYWVKSYFLRVGC